LLNALVFLFGAIIGSFLNVCIVRIPEKKSLVLDSSRCVCCGKRLGIIDLVPLLSFLWLSGKCRHCKVSLSWRYFVVELLTGLLFLLIFTRYGFEPQTLFYFILASLLVVVAFIDIKHRIIPNGLVMAGIATALPANIFGVNISFLEGLYGALAGGGILGVIALASILLLKKEGMGGGDIKLMAMAGLFIGWQMTLLSLVMAVYLATIVILPLIVLKKLKRGDHIPFGPFLSAGVIMALLYGNEIMLWYLRCFFLL